MLPEVPTTSAKVLVALAMTGGVPKNSRVGKVTRVPPPATAFMAPPAAAESISPMISAGAMERVRLRLISGSPSAVLPGLILDWRGVRLGMVGAPREQYRHRHPREGRPGKPS